MSVTETLGREQVERKGGGDTNTVRTMNNTQLQSSPSPQQNDHGTTSSTFKHKTHVSLKLQSGSGTVF